MTLDDLLAQLKQKENPENAAKMAAYHKVDRPYLGLGNPYLNALASDLRHSLEVPQRVALADGLWTTNIHEARVLAAKLLSTARIEPDAEVWALICDWVPSFDAWAIADHAAGAGSRRLVADPGRLDQVEDWSRSEHLWTKRAALTMTLPWAKLTHPKPDEIQQRERVLGWAARYTTDPQWFIQKAVAWWLRDLSKHDPDRVHGFLEAHGEIMKPFAVREASKYLEDRSAG